MSDPLDPSLSENNRWLSVADLLGAFADAPLAVIGAPLNEGSITPGRCDLAPSAIRTTLRRISTYDAEMGTDLSGLRVFDAGDLELHSVSPADAFDPIQQAVAYQIRQRDLTILLGGNNAITRPGVVGIDRTLKTVGVLTLDAHFDLRDTDLGLNNGNPIQALLEDGLPGAHISQIGIAAFANTRRAGQKAKTAGITVYTLADCRDIGFVNIAQQEVQRLASLCDSIYVDFDIDVIDRSQMPAAPGARPGGIAARDFFAATRAICSHRSVRCVDLAEFDPAMDVSSIGALTAARWFTEVLAGFWSRTSAAEPLIR
jgi:formiminoglutamase